MKVVPPIPEELWQQVPPAAQAALLAVLQHYEQRLAALQQQIDDLQQRLGQNSTNSSLPPSTDAPTVKRAPPRPASGRARGGQPGHPLQQRPLLPPDRLIACQPTACRRCGQALHGVDPEPLRHQVLELPPIRPEVTEYQRHRLRCPGCGTSTCGQLPAGVPQGQTGPRLQAVLALLTGAYRLSKRQVEALCADVLGVPLSPGQICQLEPETADTLDPVLAEIRAYVRTQPANMDETSCRELLKVEAALWTFARVEGVEPTNNAAERALRHAVQWRKTSYGTDSAAGSHFVANILSVVATCRQQGRNVLDYLTQACEATLQGLKPPSLLPQANG